MCLESLKKVILKITFEFLEHSYGDLLGFSPCGCLKEHCFTYEIV